MKTPNFFKEDYKSLLFLPFFLILKFLSIFYLIGFKVNSLFRKRRQIKLKQRVICIGNIISGGSGKTEIVLAIVRLLKKDNKKVAILTKGYKRESSSSFFVKNGSVLSPYLIGDEPAYLVRESDIFILNDRVDILKFSSLADYDYILMDDGLQDYSIYQDFRFLVFDLNYFIGNGHLLPAGPMRENFFYLKETDFIILSGESYQDIKSKRIDFLKEIGISESKIFFTNTKIVSNHNLNLKYFAFSGLGNNEKFFNLLISNNFNIEKKLEFSDHHFYKEDDIIKILKISEKNNLIPITTKKDYIKIDKKFYDRIECLEIETEIEDLDLF